MPGPSSPYVVATTRVVSGSGVRLDEPVTDPATDPRADLATETRPDAAVERARDPDLKVRVGISGPTAVDPSEDNARLTERVIRRPLPTEDIVDTVKEV